LAGVVLAIAGVVTWLSFTQEPAGAFLFPRVISVFFLALAGWNFVRASTGMAKVGTGLPMDLMRKTLPGLVIILVYVFFAAKALGFYVSSTIAFLAIFTLYDPTALASVTGWFRRVVVTLLFMAVMYGLFNQLLKVQAPRGLFF
jgi:hypothetical protein